MKKKSNKGFSLIELIIAIAILVILTGLLAPQFMKYIEKSRRAKDLQTLDTIYTGVQGALAEEDAVEELVKNGGAYATIESGMAINTIILNDDDFGNAVESILGSKPFELISKDAVKTSKGQIYVTVNSEQQVGVYWASSDDKSTPLEDLKVGISPKATP